ncbi:Vacuolar protein sorting-associated protein 13B [Saguinus oedipus]|uniref:Vacuolar protein sorting-associated protein 13B n=1 Tax=Saguinus oedipus TaxID=9490 RepID=A0ABQ9UEH3_SAGOE|nr:Vacuolar protein sorting-associated protein 13B [Saguinus oedipus]
MGRSCRAAGQLLASRSFRRKPDPGCSPGTCTGNTPLTNLIRMSLPVSLVRSIGNGVADFFRLPYEGLTRGPGAFITTCLWCVKMFQKLRNIKPPIGRTRIGSTVIPCTLTSITNLATSLARNMDRLSLDEEHYNRQEEWRRHLPESLGEGLRQGLSRLGISLLGKGLRGLLPV